MTDMTKFLELDASLKGENATEILKDIENRIWQINMIDRWTQEDKQTYENLMELQKIYLDIKKSEDEENGRK